MSRFTKVRGKGKKDERIEELKAENRALREKAARDQAEKQAATESSGQAHSAGSGQAPVSSDSMPKPKKRPRNYTQHDIRKLAYDYYEYMGGDVIDMHINNARAKCRAYASQMRVAEGRDHFNRGAWGPNVTYYEERMTGALMARLIKQKDELLEKYAAMMEKSLAEQYELQDEGYEPPKVDFAKVARQQDSAEAPQAGEPIPGANALARHGGLRFSFTEEEKQAYIDAVTTHDQNPPYAVLEIQQAIEACGQDHRRLSPDMFDIFKRTDAAMAKLHAARQSCEATPPAQTDPTTEAT